MLYCILLFFYSDKLLDNDTITSKEATKLIQILMKYDVYKDKLVDSDSSATNLWQDSELPVTNKQNGKETSLTSDSKKNDSVMVDSNQLLNCTNSNQATSNLTDEIQVSNTQNDSDMVLSPNEANCSNNINGKDEDNMDLDDSDSSIGIENFTEKYDNSPDSHCDFSDLEEPVAIGNYEDWQLRWWDLIIKDEKKSEKRRDWEVLEIISELERDSKHYFIGYDTTTKLLSFIEDHEVPDFKKKEIEILRKFQRR